MSFFQRFSADARNACEDWYGSWFLGDDAGKSIRLTLILRPQSLQLRHKGPARIDLGMTFLEINGRAYVKNVALGSPAAKAGIMSGDAVQYATLFRPEWVHSEEIAADDKDSLAIKHVLDLETKGIRTSYEELRSLLAEAMDPTQSAFLSPPAGSRSSSTWNGPPIPSTVNICVPVEAESGTPYSGETPRPVLFVFRRTRQRKSLHHLGLPTFRLDDECDFASLLVKRLAPTADMEILPPDTWEELVHDGTDWLLGRGSILPPKTASQHGGSTGMHPGETNNGDDDDDEDVPSIPLDDFEKVRALKLANLRSRMAAEAMHVDRSEDVEAVTIRGMIQKAVGLAFVRASKVVLGVSIHAGSGIVIARLSDGTWSAPSAIGTWGVGLGIQFGLEVAEYIFILQTHDALEHFKRGGSFTIGGNMGLAVAGAGREAYGAASVGGSCGNVDTVQDDEYYDNDSREERSPPQSVAVAPIVAYAKSQGLYVGVSLEGSRIYARDDINRRAYKFNSGRDVSASDILSGRVATPREAEELYAALHSVEFTHEMSCLPRPPEVLRKDSANAWYYNRSTLARGLRSAGSISKQEDPFNFLTTMGPEEADECEAFETHFKNFMYGGVSVQRLIPDESKSGRTRKERRTLWLMLPEVGSLRLGFVSKLSDGDGTVSNKSSTQRASKAMNFDGDVGTVGSEDVTLDSALNTKDGSTIANVRTGNVQLSSRHSVALTDVTVLSQEPGIPVRFPKGEDKTEHLRVISIQDAAGTSLLFLANNFREAELLVCGLKLLLERETIRLGVRGGLPLAALGGRNREGDMPPAVARGHRDTSSTRKKAKTSGYISSDACGDESTLGDNSTLDPPDKNLPEGRSSWGDVPGRNYMRGQAATVSPVGGKGCSEHGIPHYVYGQQVIRDVARNVRLPLPLPLCRVLLLDSTSPVIRTWEKDRGDTNFEKSGWIFPPATPRELERHSSEHQLIASGSMCGASRAMSFDRPRYGSMVRLAEMHSVDADDTKQLVFTVSEQNPRRGFLIRVSIILKASKGNACDATVIAEIRPVGKDMSNQAAVHKAFQLVLDEIKQRYGVEGSGLLAGFRKVVDGMTDTSSAGVPKSSVPPPFHRTGPVSDEKKVDEPPARESRKKSGLVSFEDMLKTGRQSPETALPSDRPSTPSLLHVVPEPDPSKRISIRAKRLEKDGTQNDEAAVTPKEPLLIEVKPLPKIRLSLMPSPREEDEEEDSSSASPAPSKPVKKKKKQLSRSYSSSSTKVGSTSTSLKIGSSSARKS